MQLAQTPLQSGVPNPLKLRVFWRLLKQQQQHPSTVLSSVFHVLSLVPESLCRNWSQLNKYKELVYEDMLGIVCYFCFCSSKMHTNVTSLTPQGLPQWWNALVGLSHVFDGGIKILDANIIY